MGRFRQRRTHWAWVAIVALLGNVFASAFCCAPSFAKKAEIVDAVLGTLTLCSSSGANSDDGTNQQPGSKAPHCPVCLGLTHTALLTTPYVLAPAIPVPAVTHTGAVDRHDPGAPLKLGGLGSRAPPLPA
jgi:Protein of unknown function (DUF2946)